MKINNQLIMEHLDIILNEKLNIDDFGLITQQQSNTRLMSFIEDEIYITNLLNNKSIKAVFTTSNLAKKLQNSDLICIVCNDPKYNFFTLYNIVSTRRYVENKSKIHKSAKIHSTSSISELNVNICENVIIEPNVTILSDVVIKRNSIVRAGAIIGSEGFEHKKTTKGIISVKHTGRVIIEEGVEIGANTCIDKGIYNNDTFINKYTKIDNLCHIAHSVTIGSGCFIVANSMIAGSVTIGNNVWIGPNSNILPQVIVSDNAFISVGSVVTKNVEENMRVTGNFAIPHDRFIKQLKNQIK